MDKDVKDGVFKVQVEDECRELLELCAEFRAKGVSNMAEELIESVEELVRGFLADADAADRIVGGKAPC